MYAQHSIGSNDKGTDVQAGAFFGGNPILFHSDQSLQCIHEHIFGDVRNAQTFTGAVHTIDVFHGTEHLNLAFCGAVCLHTFEHFLAVVEYAGAQFKGNGAIGNYAGIVPADAVGVVHQEHVVGEDLAEGQALYRRLNLQIFRLGDGDFHNIFSSSIKFSK